MGMVCCKIDNIWFKFEAAPMALMFSKTFLSIPSSEKYGPKKHVGSFKLVATV